MKCPAWLKTLWMWATKWETLLLIVVACGHTQELTLNIYRKPYFQAGKQQLIDFGLAEMDGKFYKPTEEGIEVFRLHTRMLLDKVRKKSQT